MVRNKKGTTELTLKTVERTYDGPTPVHALLPTSLVIGCGETMAVVGRSGSGKSTLLNVIGLLDRPSRGSYRIADIEVGTLSEAERTALRARYFGFVFQRHHLLADRTVEENVELGLMYRRLRASRRRAEALEAMEQVGISHRARAMPATLSGGEAQRVAIARALAQTPSVLLCDEPTGNLDSETAAHITDLLFGLQNDGLTVIIVTHDERLAMRAARRLEVSDGQVRESATVHSSEPPTLSEHRP